MDGKPSFLAIKVRRQKEYSTGLQDLLDIVYNLKD